MSATHPSRILQARWRAVRRQIFDRDKWRCVLCGRASRLECDHVVPLHVDPTQDPLAMEGLQALCRGCHISKTAGENSRPITPEEEEWKRYVEELQAGAQ